MNPLPMPKDICCQNFKGLIAYIRRHYGERGVREITAGLLEGEYCVRDKYEPSRIVPVAERHLTDAAYWVSNEFSLQLLANVKKVVPPPDPLYTAGRGMVRENLSRTLLFTARVVGLRRLVARAGRINARFNNTKDVHLLELAETSARFELRYRPGFRVTKDVCDWNLGIYTGIASLAGLAGVSGRETACVLDGAPHCRFEIRWKPRNRLRRRIRGLLGGVLRPGTEELVADYEKTLEERDRLIERLRRSEEKYRTLFEDSLDPMSVSRQGKLVDVNHAWLRLHGYDDPSEVTGRDVEQFVLPADRSILRKRREIWPRYDERRVQMQDMTRDGRAVPVEVYSIAIELEGRESILATVRDVSASKATESALRGIEEQLRIFIHNTPAPVAICDRSLRYLAYSQRWIEDYHLPPGDLLGRSHYEVFQSIPEKWKREHRRCLEGEIIDNEEEPFPRADGSLDWVRRKVYPWRDTRGEIGGLIMFTEVITDRKLAQAALQASEEKYRTLVENATEAIFIAQDQAIKFPNRKTLEILEYGDDAPEAIPFAAHIHPEDRAMVIERHRRRLSGETDLPAAYSFRVLSRRGTEYTVRLSAVRVDWEGRPATLNFVHDITEQKRLEKSLWQSQKMEALGTLAGGIAHDFNNLLMGIQGRASLMLLDTQAGHPHHEHLKGIERYIETAAVLTRQMLGFARRGKYEIAVTDLNGVVEHSAEMFGRTRKEIRITRKLQPGLWTAEVDPVQVQQVLLNLYVNAWQAMPAGGDLCLQTENVVLAPGESRPDDVEPGPYVRISVTDSGTGMDRSILGRIFDPFFTTKGVERGTGLGLASAYGILKNHGGAITVESEPGRGSTFRLFFPAADGEVPAPAEVSRPLRAGSGTVLLVDDEALIHDVGRPMLETLGYRVLSARSGPEALELVAAGAPAVDLVILDMIMPGMGGRETFERLKARAPGIKVLLCSGYSQNGQATEILQRGCDGFIQKPFDLQILSEKLREALSADPHASLSRS